MIYDKNCPLVSVITPFYNTDQYLAGCIRSVLAQTYGNFEYILVNNCSTDSSAEIARSFARQDSRIRVIDNPALLPKVENYNHAIEQMSASSKYMKIAQADDSLYPGCIDEMVSLAEANPSVGLVSSYYILGTRVSNIGLPCDKSVFNGRDICRLQLLDGSNFYFGNYSTVMARSEIARARRPCYTPDTYNDDTEFCYEVLGDWDFGFVHQVLSFTREGNESLSQSISTFGPEYPDYFIALNKYGPKYLSEAEFETRLSATRYWYMRYLAQQLFRGRDDVFWDFHKRGWHIAGQSLERRAVLRRAAIEVALLIPHPRRLAGLLFGRG